MRNFLGSTAVCYLSVLCLGGCQPDQPPLPAKPPAGGVAVVDLAEVVKRLGKDVDLNKSLRQERESLARKTQQFQLSLNADYNKKVQEFGENPTEQQEQELAALRNEHALRLNRERISSQNTLHMFQQRLVDRVREQTKPAASAVATERGLTLVITRHEGVLIVDPQVDITDEVIAKMLADADTPAQPDSE